MDPILKTQYLDNVAKTKVETLALFDDLDIKPIVDPQCSSKKTKRNLTPMESLRSLISDRSLLSDLTDLDGDIAKLLSCGVQVVDNLNDVVDVPGPDLNEIETLTDTLASIGEDLQGAEDNDDEPSNSASQSEPSSTSTLSITSSASASSCASGTAVPYCTKMISLSTSFLSGNTANPTVSSVMSMDCTTVTGCSVMARTATITASASATSGISMCAPSCSACAADSVPVGNASSLKVRRNDLLDKRNS